MATNTSGRAWARLGFGFGIAASLGANVADVLTRPNEPIGGVLSAAWWPVALLIALEILTRVAWPGGFWWRVTRYGGVLVVALIAALASYTHMTELLTTYGEGWLAHIEPLSVDGLLVVSSMALLAISDNLRNRLPVIEAIE